MAEYDVTCTETQCCNADGVCWAAPGSTGFTASAPTPGTSLIGKDGRGIPNTTPAIDPLTQQQVSPPPEAVPIEQTPWYESGGYSGGGYSRSSNRSGYAGGGSYAGAGYSGGTFGGGFGGGAPPTPRYADGSTHPFFGGAPRTPGGVFAAQSGETGYGGGVQVTASSGATAGPYEISAAPAPDGGSPGGGGYGAGSGGGGGGGGLARDMISRIRGNVMGKVSGMGPGGSSSASGDTASYLRQQQRYKQQGRRMDRASDRYNEALGEPQYMPVRGWAKRQGYKPGMVGAALTSPGSILSDVFPGLELNEATDTLTDMPMTDLAMLTFGSRGRSLMSRTPTVDVPGILRRQAGYEEIEPEFKRSLNPSKAVNKIALLYRKMAEGQQFDTEALLGNLAHTKKNSALGQGLAQQAEFDPGGALGQIGSYVHSAFAPMGDSAYTRSLHRDIDRDLMALGPKALRKKPERIHKAARQIGRSFLG